jgi:BlaI family transcriptional regulator, penicillinase repressor
MSRTPQDITETELAVMEALWVDGGPRTIRQLAEALYTDSGTTYYATVQKLLERLEEKACVRRDRAETPHTFAAVVTRSELIGRRLQVVARQMCGGSLTPLLTHLVQARSMTPRERQDLRDLIDGLDEENRDEKPRRKR